MPAPTPTPTLASASTPPLDQLRDELDLLLVDYLQAIEHYQQSRHRLETRLKSGFFDLARAKLALGPANVGPAKYDLTEHASHKVVRITPNEKEKDTTANAPSWSFALADRPDNDEDDDDDDDDDTDSEQLHPTLRRRARTTTTRSRSRSDTPPPPDTAVTHAAGASSPTEKQQRPPPPPPPPRPSPLTQFAALPPPALRASAAAFTQAVQVAVGIVDAEARVRDCARRIKRARKGIDRRRDEEEEAEEEEASSGLSHD